jgi:hypothetical protein
MQPLVGIARVEGHDAGDAVHNMMAIRALLLRTSR